MTNENYFSIICTRISQRKILLILLVLRLLPVDSWNWSKPVQTAAIIRTYWKNLNIQVRIRKEGEETIVLCASCVFQRGELISTPCWWEGKVVNPVVRPYDFFCVCLSQPFAKASITIYPLFKPLFTSSVQWSCSLSLDSLNQVCPGTSGVWS